MLEDFVVEEIGDISIIKLNMMRATIKDFAVYYSERK
jgi:hypothetical protein